MKNILENLMHFCLQAAFLFFLNYTRLAFINILAATEFGIKEEEFLYTSKTNIAMEFDGKLDGSVYSVQAFWANGQCAKNQTNVAAAKFVFILFN